MAVRLGFWATIYPNTRVFVPERPILTLEWGCQALPTREHKRLLVVLSAPNDDGMREPLGYCAIIG